MKTDYKNLNLFDASAVAVALIGICLISTLVFFGLPAKDQDNVTKALSMFDLHDEALQEVSAVEGIFNISNNYMDQFYIAFSEVAIMPAEIFTVPASAKTAWNNLLAYADVVGETYRENNSSSTQYIAADNGEVLGAMIVSGIDSLNFDQDQINPDAFSSENELVLPYSFNAPSWDLFRPQQNLFTISINN
ncbi:MAG TPA: hypothetical protein VL306_02140 [Methylomirabilota bacterium]|jgi:hypothetical protein|nr:hypothetical protein [Methylomirabilota bacterium]